MIPREVDMSHGISFVDKEGITNRPSFLAINDVHAELASPAFSTPEVVAGAKIAVEAILFGVLTALIVFLFLNRKIKLAKTQKMPPFSRWAFFVTALFVTSAGFGCIYLYQSAIESERLLAILVDSPVSQDSPVVGLPQTGSHGISSTSTYPISSIDTTPVYGLSTALLLIAIVILIIAVIQSITVRRRTELDLKEAKVAAQNVLEDLQIESQRLVNINARDEALLESIGDGVIATDQGGNIIVMNKAAEELLGLRCEDVVGKKYLKIITFVNVDGEEIPDSERPIAMALSVGKATTNMGFFARKDGVKIPVAEHTTPVLLYGKPTGAILVFRDTTKEKEIEKLRTDFLSLASHQLRTPLSGTKWLIETIQRGVLGPMNSKQQKYIDNLYEINERMIKLVAEMLGVLVLESSGDVPEKNMVSVSKVYEELLVMVGPAASKKGVVLNNLFKGREDIYVHANLQAIRSVLESLVGNAINYSQAGQEVALNVAEDDLAVVFSVRDYGIGIPPEEQKRVFERFYRASNAKISKPDGTGLGLYTAYLLSRKFGGKIYFVSKENVGTTFYLGIPKENDIEGGIISEQ